AGARRSRLAHISQSSSEAEAGKGKGSRRAPTPAASSLAPAFGKEKAKSPDESREQGVHDARMQKCPPGRLLFAGPGRQRDVERCGRFTILTAGNRVDPSLVGRTCPASALGDVQTNAGRGPQGLIAQATVADGRLPHRLEQFASLLVSDQFLKGKISKVRHRRLLSRAQRGAGDDERLESRETHTPKAQAFSFLKCRRQCQRRRRWRAPASLSLSRSRLALSDWHR